MPRSTQIDGYPVKELGAVVKAAVLKGSGVLIRLPDRKAALSLRAQAHALRALARKAPDEALASGFNVTEADACLFRITDEGLEVIPMSASPTAMLIRNALAEIGVEVEARVGQAVQNSDTPEAALARLKASLAPAPPAEENPYGT